VVVSTLHPRTAFLDQVGREHLPPDFAADIERWKTRSGVVKINLALAELPDFTADPGSRLQEHHTGSVEMAPTMEYIERAFTEAREGRPATRPFSDGVIPTAFDKTLRPEGTHIMSLFTQWVPADWSTQPHTAELEAYADRMIDCYNELAPNFKAAILHRGIEVEPLRKRRHLGRPQVDAEVGVHVLRHLVLLGCGGGELTDEQGLVADRPTTRALPAHASPVDHVHALRRRGRQHLGQAAVGEQLDLIAGGERGLHGERAGLGCAPKGDRTGLDRRRAVRELLREQHCDLTAGPARDASLDRRPGVLPPVEHHEDVVADRLEPGRRRDGDGLAGRGGGQGW